MPEKISIMNPREKQVYTWFLVVVLVLFCLATYISRFNPLEVLWEQGEFWKFLFQDFLPPRFNASPVVVESILVTFALAVSSSFVAAVFAFFSLCSAALLYHHGRDWPERSGGLPLFDEYPDTGLGFYSFFVTGYWYRGWFYCFADFDLCLL